MRRQAFQRSQKSLPVALGALHEAAVLVAAERLLEALERDRLEQVIQCIEFKGLERVLIERCYEYDSLSIVRAQVLDQIKARSEEHTSELQSRGHLVCRLLLEKKKPL